MQEDSLQYCKLALDAAVSDILRQVRIYLSDPEPFAKEYIDPMKRGSGAQY